MRDQKGSSGCLRACPAVQAARSESRSG